jgi:hypothetical protein
VIDRSTSGLIREAAGLVSVVDVSDTAPARVEFACLVFAVYLVAALMSWMPMGLIYIGLVPIGVFAVVLIVAGATAVLAVLSGTYGVTPVVPIVTGGVLLALLAAGIVVLVLAGASPGID